MGSRTRGWRKSGERTRDERGAKFSGRILEAERPPVSTEQVSKSNLMPFFCAFAIFVVWALDTTGILKGQALMEGSQSTQNTDLCSMSHPAQWFPWLGKPEETPGDKNLDQVTTEANHETPDFRPQLDRRSVATRHVVFLVSATTHRVSHSAVFGHSAPKDGS